MSVIELIEQLKAMPEKMEGFDSEGGIVVLNTHKAAEILKKSLRNCDVGTAEEQSDRFDKFCYSHKTCLKCPVKSLWNCARRKKQLREITRCEIIWGQMPYEKVK